MLIAHQDCALYTQRLNTSPLQLETQQHEYMVKAVQRVRGLGPYLRIDTYFARKQDGNMISFEPVTV